MHLPTVRRSTWPIPVSERICSMENYNPWEPRRVFMARIIWRSVLGGINLGRPGFLCLPSRSGTLSTVGKSIRACRWVVERENPYSSDRARIDLWKRWCSNRSAIDVWIGTLQYLTMVKSNQVWARRGLWSIYYAYMSANRKSINRHKSNHQKISWANSESCHKQRWILKASNQSSMKRAIEANQVSNQAKAEFLRCKINQSIQPNSRKIMSIKSSSSFGITVKAEIHVAWKRF